MATHRIVTGTSADGKAVIVSDEDADMIDIAGLTMDMIGSSDRIIDLPFDGKDIDTVRGFWPPPGGYRFFIGEFAPATGSDVEGSAPDDSRLDGLFEVMEPDNPGMHRSNTIDLELMLSGELTLELDDGQTQIVREGDAIIMNGTRHRWINHTDKPARTVTVLLGARAPE